MMDMERLLEVIRDELTRALQPVIDGQARLERQLGETYTREVTDLKFSDLQRQLNEIKAEKDELKQQLGGFWQNAITRAAGWVGLGLAVIELLKGIKL